MKKSLAFLRRAPAMLLLAGLFHAPLVSAGEVTIVDAVFNRAGAHWNASVTLRHADTGWEHYADAWRVVDAQGKVIKTRTLYHPHVDEQPFTRSLRDIEIPADTTVVYIEAHDRKHGWAPQRMKVELNPVFGRGKAVGLEPRPKGKD